MVSFISHFEKRAPRLALRLLAAVLLSWAGCAVYTLWLSPEIIFAKAAARTKQKWSRQITREHGRKFLVFGGSSCMFSIDGERMLQRHGLPLVNMGLLAGQGGKIITEWTLSEVRRGDTLVAAFEPGLVMGDIEPTSAGIQFSYAMQSPQWIKGMIEPVAPLGPGSLMALRPGGYHAFTLLGKVVQGRPLYRYSIENIQPSGWVQTPVRVEFNSSPGNPDKISADGRSFLGSLRDWCRTNDVRVAYSLPLGWCPAEDVETFQSHNASFLLELSEFLLVMEDRRLGAHTNRALFADTPWHLNSTGVALRTDELAQQLRTWRMWDPGELRRAATRKSLSTR